MPGICHTGTERRALGAKKDTNEGSPYVYLECRFFLVGVTLVATRIAVCVAGSRIFARGACRTGTERGALKRGRIATCHYLIDRTCLGPGYLRGAANSGMTQQSWYWRQGRGLDTRI